MIPLAVPNLNGNERKYLNQCIDTTFISSVGEFVNKIEELTAQACGTKYAVAMSSGTTALHLSLIGTRVSRDDIVIIPNFTFIATANAVSHCGAVPWVMDISPDSWTLDVSQLESELSLYTEKKNGGVYHIQSGRRVAAIMPVYTLGNIPDMDKLNEIAEYYGLPVVSDAAAAIGARYKNKNLGELAELTALSFNGNKTVTAGGGGAIAGNNKELMTKLKHLSTTARVTPEYDHDMVGYNYRMTNIQAAVGCAQLERVNELVSKKREIRAFYNSEFENLENVSLFPIPWYDESACWLSGIILNNNSKFNVRNLCNELKNNGIEARSFWKPISLQTPYKDCVKSSSLKVSENLWDKIITLPSSTTITSDELKYVAETVKRLVVDI